MSEITALLLAESPDPHRRNMVPRHTTATALGLLAAATMLVLGATAGVAAAAPGQGPAHGPAARAGGTDLGPAAAAPATATPAAEPGAGVADQVAAGPGTNDASTTAPATDIATAAAAPRVGIATLVAHPPASLSAVLALLVAVLLFLVLHPALDRHDERLALAGVDDDLARFR